jgi:outer membrane protein assembly factor BamD (BamD/ComL family)
VKRNDTDASIGILKRLDLYLTPAEAESMQETVRSVFKDKLNALRTQFSLAVQDHHWHEAVRLGETIMTDFPNSRIATEVKESMDSLRKRAADAPEEATARA